MNVGRSYYNEIDPVACEVLRECIRAGVIAPGDVDGRSIKDVQPGDLAGYTQCHFFAGAGLWPVAARFAGWPDARQLWSGSCPCQGESLIGKRLGADDPRHLWPDFFRLIRACRPSVVVGEQVAAAAGTHWLDGICTDLAGENYAARAVDIPACAVDAPHQRNRLYWLAVDVGDGIGAGLEGQRRHGNDGAGWSAAHRPIASSVGRNGSFWADGEWIDCHDGNARRAKPGIRMLVDGMAGRADFWRLVGNSIVPQLAAEVLAAFLETEGAE